MDKKNKDCECNHNHDNEDCGCNHDHEHGECGCNHDHEDCGCGHDHEHEHEGYQTIYLTLDDDSELNCHVLGTFEVEEKSYIALLPEEEERVLLYEYNELEEGQIELKNIESEEEFEYVSEAFNELFDDLDEGEE